MSESDRRRFEYRRRLESADAEHDEVDSSAQRALRIENQAAWVDVQVQQAMRRGDFDDLPGAGKPIRGIDRPHDPDWWLKQLIERERITGVLPPALALRTEDAGLDNVLDRIATEDGVREALADFNARVVDARRQLQGGPPVVTPLRDVAAELDAWRGRRAARLAEQKQRLAEIRAAESDERRRRPWWRRSR